MKHKESSRENIGLDDSAEWIYKKTTKGAEPTLTRQSEIALVEDIETGKDGSHERCCVCGNEHRQRDPLMKCDYCPRVAHQKQCVGMGRNHKILFQCPACKESGTYTMTEEATEYWNKKKGKKQITIEEWLSKAATEIREMPAIRTPNDNGKPVSPEVMDEILGTPIWQISEARIHRAREVRTPQKAAKWIQEIMEGDSIDKIRIEAKKSGIIPVYIRRWDTYTWAWLEYNRKDQAWIYGGIQKNKDKADENKEGQGRIREMFTDNHMDIRERGRQSWDDSGRDNEDSDAGIWMVETLRRRLKIGVTKRSKVNIKRVRREMLAAYIWKEESFRVEMEEAEKERRTKKTKTKTTETEEENKTESGETEATRKTWEARQTTKNMENKTLKGMGFNEKAE